MKSQNQEQKLTESQTKAKKPRFTIEKLEERIAPKRFYNPKAGKFVGAKSGTCSRG